jgi:hypothetical protein
MPLPVAAEINGRVSIYTVSSAKAPEHRHRRQMGARHLDYESAFDLISGVASENSDSCVSMV